jgi:hypothetical protein
MYDLYKAKEIRRGREDTMTFVVNMDIMNVLMREVGVNKEGMLCNDCFQRNDSHRARDALGF